MKKSLRHIGVVKSGHRFFMTILIFATILGKTADAQPGSVIFKDEFSGNTLSNSWQPDDNWTAANGLAYSIYDFGQLVTSKNYDSDSYVIETTAKGFTSSYWREFRIIFGQLAPNDQKTYVFTYAPDLGGQFILGKSTDNIYYPQTLDAVGAYPKLEKDKPYKFKIARYKSGLIQIYLDKGAGYGAIPLLEAIDNSHKNLGHFGWQVSTQTAPEAFYVDRIEAKVPQTEKPAVPEKPAEDKLITQVSASSGKVYKVGKLDVGSSLYTDRAFLATSVPDYLKGASFVQTAMDDKKEADKFELITYMKKQSVVYVAYDLRATVLPDWLKNWHKTGDIIGTNDPKLKHLEVYSKLVDSYQYYPYPFLLGGNLASPAVGAQSNYIVAAVESPVSQNLQAEDAFVSGAKVASDRPGYAGTGFVDFINNNKDYIEWTTQVKVAGTYSLSFQFANGSAKPRSVAISVDNNFAQNASFPSLTNWDNWATFSGPRFFLKAGTHKIKMTAIGQSGPNIDFLNLYYFDAAPEGIAGGSIARTGNVDFDETNNTSHFSPTAYPNPFETTTNISYELTEKAKVNLTVYSTNGRKQTVLIDKILSPGKYETAFPASNLPEGIYIYSLQINGKVHSGKVVKISN